MTGTWLPPELIEMVMDHLRLHSDRRTLAACSVVCKAWIHPARSRLFADISLNDIDVEKFLESRSAVIGMPLIRHLHVEIHDPSIWNENVHLLVSFKSIRSLSLVYFPWRDLFPMTQLSLRTHFATIVCLRLYEFRAHPFSELAEVICSFRRLETLVIDGARWARWDDSDTPPSPLCLSDNLRILEVQDCEADSILKWLLSLERMPALHTVYLHESELDEIDRFLQALGVSLEVFWCGSYSYQAINLSYNTCLRVLHFELDNQSGWVVAARQRVTQWVIQVLSQIVSEHMNRVVFEIIVDTDDPPDILEWTELESILELPPFSRLKNVDINVLKIYDDYYLSEELDFPAWFISHLPRCHARGILGIHLDEKQFTYF